MPPDLVDPRVEILLVARQVGAVSIVVSTISLLKHQGVAL